MTPRRCEAGDLELGAGLETLVSAALETTAPDGDLDVECASRSSAFELAAWARVAGHRIVAERTEGRGSERRFVVRIRRSRSPAVRSTTAGLAPDLSSGSFTTADLRSAAGPPPERADAGAGFVPLGAIVDGATTGYEWVLSERDRIWADELASLADRAARAQWDAVRDIPWEAAQGLPRDVERAVCQVTTYIAQNEYAAYYVPARYLAQVNPSFLEALMWLASHVHDEARHVEAFTKRSLAGGIRAPALSTTELSLRTLLDERDFTAASLLLNVLGEGTFLDLLAFVDRYAPDAATATAARLARRDEHRHVHFGIAHVRRRLALDPDERHGLVAAVEARAAKLVSLDGVSPALTEALVLMAARSRQPSDIAEAGRAVRSLLERMHRHRIRRLQAAGFDRPTAEHLSELHTPNLM